MRFFYHMHTLFKNKHAKGSLSGVMAEPLLEVHKGSSHSHLFYKNGSLGNHPSKGLWGTKCGSSNAGINSLKINVPRRVLLGGAMAEPLLVP